MFYHCLFWNLNSVYFFKLLWFNIGALFLLKYEQICLHYSSTELWCDWSWFFFVSFMLSCLNSMFLSQHLFCCPSLCRWIGTREGEVQVHLWRSWYDFHRTYWQLNAHIWCMGLVQLNAWVHIACTSFI